MKSFIEDIEDEGESSESETEGEGRDETNVVKNLRETTSQKDESETYSLEVTPKNKGREMSKLPSTTQTDNSTPCFEAEIVDTSPENNAVVVDSSPEIDGYADVISTMEDKENIVVHNQEWACPTCTLVNKKSVRKCSVCGTRKLMNTNVVSSQSSTRKKRSISELK